MKTINFALGLHNHQPVGNFDSVFKEAFDRAYIPFLEVLERHPRIRVSLHYTGPLWDWMLKENPDFIPRLKRLVEGGQVEMLGGGYYEPILPNIPDRDKKGQILRMSETVKKLTDRAPSGMWTAERVWEPHLAKPLSDAGVRYTILDEAHFRYAGLEEKDIFNYYITEEEGRTICVFPISYSLRHLIPFSPPEKTIEFLYKWATEGGERLAVMADDGEKFGIWPGTYKVAYEEKWLDRFFELIEENAPWIRMLTFSDFMEKYPPAGRVYLPAASYFEMLEWALPTRAAIEFQNVQREIRESGKWDDYENFLKGGFWRNFLTKYPESNNMQKKALFVSRKVEEMQGPGREDARMELWRGQCNCAYWHGVFGGLYLPHLRSAIYHHLISAEKLADRERHGGHSWAETAMLDLDKDGHDEVLLETDIISCGLAPASGGQMFELDYRPIAVNYLDTLTRREEAYHRKVWELAGHEDEDGGLVSIHEMARAKEKGLERHLKYDWYRRTSLLDHFLHPATTLDLFKDATYGEEGNFVTGGYRAELSTGDTRAEATLSRDGQVWNNGEFLPLRLEKKISLKPGERKLSVHYTIKNTSHRGMDLWFAPEFNFSFLSPSAQGSSYIHPGLTPPESSLDSTGELPKETSIRLRDGIRKVDLVLSFNREAMIWRCPVETVSQSESGFERTYQSSVVLPGWKISLGRDESWSVALELTFEELSGPSS
jgi:alpha-amylase